MKVAGTNLAVLYNSTFIWIPEKYNTSAPELILKAQVPIIYDACTCVSERESTTRAFGAHYFYMITFKRPEDGPFP